MYLVRDVQVESGTIEIALLNEMPVEITRLEMTLMNQNDSSVIGKFYFENIPVGATYTEEIVIEDQTLYNNLLMFVDTFNIEGSGLNPFDQSTYVPLSYDQGVDVFVKTKNFIITEGLVRFPEEQGPSDTIIVDLEFENDMILSKMNVDEGDFNCSFESSVKTDIDVNFTIPQLKNEFGEAFQFSFIVSNTEQDGTQNSSYAMDGYNFDLSQSLNKLEVYYSTNVIATPEYEDHVVYSEDDSIRISIGLDNMEFNSIEGYFGQVVKTIDASEFSLELNTLQEIATGIVLEDPKITFIADNSMGIPFSINLNMEGLNNGEMVSLNGPNIEIDANGISSTEYNHTNSQIVDFIALNPDVMMYSGEATSNPEGNLGELNFITPESGLEIGFEMNLPFHLRMENTTLSDTLGINYKLPSSVSDNIEEYLVSGELILAIENGFPFDAEVLVYFKDSLTSIKLDSLEFDLIESAEVNTNGKVENPSYLNYSIQLNEEKYLNIIEANQVIINVVFSSYEFENTSVKLYTDYEINIGMGILSELNTN